MRRVVVTGLGAVTPLGVGTRATWRRLIEGHCGIKSTASWDPAFAAIPSKVVAVVPQGSRKSHGWKASEWISPEVLLFAGALVIVLYAKKYEYQELRKTALFSQYAIAAAAQALEDAGWNPVKEEDLEATGVCLGSGIGNLDEMVNTCLAYSEKKYTKIHPLFVPRLLINLGAGHISMRWGFKGPNHAVTTACTTGAHSIGDASRFIAHGDANVMLAGGAESCIHPLAIGGFARSRSLCTAFNDDPASSSRPFDKDRDGFVIGEGAGVMVLEELDHAVKRGVPIYAEIIGYGTSADAHHLTAPLPDGSGALRAMRMAMRSTGVTPQQIDYINAHATSTKIGDEAENHAIKLLMQGREVKEVAVSSTKGAIGHLLGAAGAVEAIFTVLAIKESIIPPTLNLKNPSENFEFNYVPKVAQQKRVDVALSNSFGFGGTNASLCFKAFRPGH